MRYNIQFVTCQKIMRGNKEIDETLLQQIKAIRKQSFEESIQMLYKKIIRDPMIKIFEDCALLKEIKCNKISQILVNVLNTETEISLVKISNELNRTHIENQLLYNKIQKLSTEIASLELKLQHQVQLEYQNHKLVERVEIMALEKVKTDRIIKETMKGFNTEFVNDLEFNLKRLVNDINFKQKSLKSRQDIINGLNKEISELKQQNIKLMQQNSKRQHYNNQNFTNSSSSLKIQNYERKLKEKESQLRQFKNKTQKFINDLKLEIQEYRNQEKQITEFQNQIKNVFDNQLREEKKVNKNNIQILQKNQSQLTTHLMNKLTYLQELQEENLSIKNTYDKLDKQYVQKETNYLKKIEDQSYKIQSLEQKLNQESEFEKENKKLKNQVLKLRSQKQVLKMEKQHLIKKIESKCLTISELNNQINQLYRACQERIKQSSKQNEQIVSLKIENEFLKNNNSKSNGNLMSNQKYFSELHKDILLKSTELRLEKNYLHEFDALLTEKTKQYENSISQIQQQNKKLQEQLKALKSKIKQSENMYQKSLNQKNQTIQNLQNEKQMMNHTFLFERKIHQEQKNQMKKILSKEKEKNAQNKSSIISFYNSNKIDYKFSSTNNRESYRSKLLQNQVTSIIKDFKSLKAYCIKQLQNSRQFLKQIVQNIVNLLPITKSQVTTTTKKTWHEDEILVSTKKYDDYIKKIENIFLQEESQHQNQ